MRVFSGIRAACLVMAAIATAGCGGGASEVAQPSPPPGRPAPGDADEIAALPPGSRLAPGWHHGAFMQIYVRAYKDSNGDGIGDLQGLISKLDYLADLGIKGIWLMPVTASSDHDHGYAVEHYRAIEADYGSLADVDELLAKAHERGIGVILDYVINHSSSRHPLFIEAAAAGDGSARSMYVWQGSRPTGWSVYGRNPWHPAPSGAAHYFGAFDGSMPDFNWREPAVTRFHHDNLRFWLNRGVDGMRFDAVGNLVENGPRAWENQPDNHTIMAGVRRVLDRYDGTYAVCEAPSAAQAFAAASSCGAAFAFDLRSALVGAAHGRVSDIERLGAYFLTAPLSMATMVGNHDAFAGPRLWNAVGADIAKYKLAAASYLLMPGTPFIYYGEEVGMGTGNGTLSDPMLRAPMSWTDSPSGFSSATPFRAPAPNLAAQNAASQIGVPGSLHSHYRALIRLRNTHASIARGRYEAPVVAGQVLSFRRVVDTETTWVAINYGTTAADVAIPDTPTEPQLVFGDAVMSPPARQRSLRLGPQAAAVLLLTSSPQ